MSSSSTVSAGIPFMLAAMFVFSANDALAKYLAALCPVAQLLLIRNAGALVLIAPKVHAYGWLAAARVPRVWLHVLRCVLIVMELALFYTAVWQIPLADTLTTSTRPRRSSPRRWPCRCWASRWAGGAGWP
ncbi:hypothetical protein [Vineibacter terrae]|uniref:hypothetical protein n=1 Tax=Vineibacter terrae TaxID=2586908 RepID=UPI0015B3DF94|nr:hypothetical protein [Vineibacter terrae]